jgi:HAD superfamily hydrolase (TIGR01490 family)
MDRPYFAFFDVDHTLMRGSTSTAFGKALWRADIVGFPDLAMVLVWNLMYAVGRIDEVEIWHKSVARLIGKAEAPIRKACEDAHHRNVVHQMYVEGRDEVVRHQQAGAHVALISAGPRYSVFEVARTLGIDVDLVATAWANVLEGRVHDLEGVEIPYGPMKRVYAQRYCEKFGVDPADCWAYGDSKSDIEMLEFVGHPVAVNPRRALRHVAEARGWKVVEWSHMTPQLVVARPST